MPNDIEPAPADTEAIVRFCADRGMTAPTAMLACLAVAAMLAAEMHFVASMDDGEWVQ